MNGIKIGYYLTFTQDSPKNLEGKPLGFITRQQFYLLYTDPKKFVRKVLSCQQVTLNDLADCASLIKQHRLIYSTTNEQNARCLFVSAELSHITSVNSIKDRVVDLELIDKNNRILYIESKLIG